MISTYIKEENLNYYLILKDNYNLVRIKKDVEKYIKN